MSYQVNTIANFFIEKSREQSRANLTPMKLLKLVYIAQGWHLAVLNRSLFDEEIEAWKFGPVQPNLYRAVKHYRNYPVLELIPTRGDNNPIGDDSKAVLEAVWKLYRDKDGLQLSSLTHQKGSPWDSVWREGHNAIIPTDKIKEHYKALLHAANQQEK